jgi:hypothetical protein
MADLRTLARYYIDELHDGAVLSNSSDQLDLTTMVQYGYEQYARDTRCYPVNYEMPSMPGQQVYPFSYFQDFGAVAIWMAGTGYTAGQYVREVANGPIYICLVNVTSTATPSQDSMNWGLAPLPGKRLFRLRIVFYDELRLNSASLDDLDKRDFRWRFNPSGTPRFWYPYGESKIGFYPAPSGTANIYVEGWETPDLTTFSADADEPDVTASDRYLIAIKAALYPAVRLMNNENSARRQELVNDYNLGIIEANSRINSQARVSVYGRNAGGASSYPPISSTVTTL